MNLLLRGKEALIRRSFRKMTRELATATPDTLLTGSSAKVLSIFRHAAKTVPAYRRLLEKQGISPHSISSLERFREQVPILDKKCWFNLELRDLCVNGNLNDIASVYSSSGHSRSFSFGMETRREQLQSPLLLEFELQQLFRALDRRTLLINCLPMGVRVHTRSLALAETSVREDIILALIKKLSADFEQFILLGEHTFLKHLIETGLLEPYRIDWRKLRIHVITGAEYVAESFRSYLTSLLGIDPADPNSGLLIVNYGLSELSVSIAHENWHTIQIRRLAHTDRRFREILCGDALPFCPNVGQYYPTQVYLETLRSQPDREELGVTLLSPNRRLPMIRYNTGDRAQLISYNALATILKGCGRPDLIPSFRLPLVLLWGKSSGLDAPGGIIYPEQIKEALYADFNLASQITGNFLLRKSETTSSPRLLVQLREGVQASPEMRSAIGQQVQKAVTQPLEIDVLLYRDFPLGIRHDFERKNRYLDLSSDSV